MEAVAALLYLAASLASTVPVSRRRGRAQALVELALCLLLPGAGLGIVLVLHRVLAAGRLETGEVRPEQENPDAFFLQDRDYNENIIPMSDIFLLDDAKLKRKYFTEAIRQDMVSNPEILRDAVHDKDREIAYFAVSLMTARMEELSNELFRLGQRIKQEQASPELLKEYVAKLKVFLDNGYGNEMGREQQRKAYLSALELLSRQIPDQPVYYRERIEMLLRSRQFAEAETACRQFARAYAGREEPILMAIRLYQNRHEPEKLQEKIRELKALPHQLSPEALQVIRFWDKEAAHA